MVYGLNKYARGETAFALLELKNTSAADLQLEISNKAYSNLLK